MNNEIWKYGKNKAGKTEYKLYTEDEDLKDRIIGNKGNPYRGYDGCRLHNAYYNNNIRPREVVGWDIIFPRELKKRIEGLMG